MVRQKNAHNFKNILRELTFIEKNTMQTNEISMPFCTNVFWYHSNRLKFFFLALFLPTISVCKNFSDFISHFDFQGQRPKFDHLQ